MHVKLKCEPDFVAIMFTLQLRVKLDSILNSCDVCLLSLPNFLSSSHFFFNWSVFFCAYVHTFVTREKNWVKLIAIAESQIEYVPCKKMTGESQ